MFKYQLSDKLKDIIQVLNKKARKRSLILAEKIQEIVKNDIKTIERYKNLRHELKDYKRVHIDRHFVLIFKVDKEKNFIFFADFDHHDNMYKK